MQKNLTPQSCSPFALKSALWLCVALTGATSFKSSAQTLVPKWQNSDVGATVNRDMAYNPATGNILLVKNTPAIVRLLGTDGTSAGADMDLTDVAQGTFLLAGLAVLNDGTIFACNYVTGAQGTTPLKIYQWDSETVSPTLVASLTGTAGATGDRYGAAMDAFVIPGVSTNLLIAGNLTTCYLAIFDSSGWNFKVLTYPTYTQVMVPAGSFVDYNATGFANKFRIVAKSRGSNGRLFNFDPSATSPINIEAGVTPIAAPFVFIANGITSHDYNPVTRLLAGTTCTLQAAPFSYTNIILSTASGVAAPTDLPPRIILTATGADGGQAGATVWGTDGRLYTSVCAAGAGVNAFDVTAFLVSGPGNVIGTVGDASAIFTGAAFGGSALTYQWKSNGVDIVDSTKYSGATTLSLTVSNLVAADTGTYSLYATGINSSFATASATLTVNFGPTGPKTWDGGDVDDNNWSSADNWDSALNFAGDIAFFAGSTRLTPVMDGSYDLSGLTFNSAAGAFNISASSGTLTMGGGVTNNSATEQTLSLPMSLSGIRNFDTASSNIVVTGAIGGSGGITKLGTETLKLRGTSANTFAGTLAINAGNVVFGKTAGVNPAGGAITFGSGTKLTLEASDQIPNTTLLNLQSSGGTLELLAGVTETIRGFPAGGLTVAAVSGNVELGAGAQLTIAPILGVGDSAVSITAASPAGTKFIVSAGATGSEIRFTPSVMVNTFEKLVIINGGKLRCGHGGNAWSPPETMLGAVPASFMQDQISITNGLLGLNGLLPIPTVMVNANRGMIIAGNATNETIANAVFPGKITGPGTLWHTGGAATAPGNLELLGLNDFSGGLKLGTGALIAGNAAAVGPGPIAFISNAGRLAVSANGIVITNHIDLSAVITNSFGLVNDFELSGNVDLGSTGVDPQINVTNPANTVTFSGQLTNTLGLVKNGAGRVSLAGNNNTYGGPTTVLNGTLLVNNTSGSATSSGTVTAEVGGTLGGNGIIPGQVTINGRISPGNSVGTLTTADETWNGGGHYQWEMNDATGTAGSSPGWDKITINGALNISSAPGNEFLIDVTSLAGAVAGNTANFNNTTAQSWTILTTTAGINGFSAGAVKVTTSGFSNPLGAARFDITNSVDGKDLIVRLLVDGTIGNGSGLIGAYYNAGAGPSPTSFPDPAALERLDATVNFDWGLGSPDPSVNTNNFVVRWTGQVQPFYSDNYTFITTTDDGARLWVNGQLVIDDWIDHGPVDTTASTPVALVGGQKYGIVMEYYENAVGAVAKLSWSTAGRSKEIIPQTQLYPATVPNQPTVSASPDHSQMTITWVGTFVLQSAPDITGPWTPVGVSSPYTFTIDPNTPQQYFRLVSQ